MVLSSTSPTPHDTPPPLWRQDWFWLTLILLAAALLRVWYLAEVVQAPDFRALRQDLEVQDYQARAMLSGDWTVPEGRSDPKIATTPYYRPPGYPYLLALVYLATDGSYLAPRVLNMALGLLSIVLVFLLGRAVCHRAVGLLAAAGMAGYWGFIYYEGEVNDPAVFVFLIPCLFWALRFWGVSFKARWALLAGLITGFYAIMRPNILLFGPFMAAWMLWVAWGAGRLRRVPAAWAGLAAATFLVIAPVTVRNYAVSGEFVPVSTYFGQNFLIGNGEDSDGYTSWTPYLQKLEGTGRFSVWEYDNMVRGLGREVGNGHLTHSEASKIFFRKGLDYALAHPRRTLLLALKKMVLFWSPWEITENKVVQCEKDHYPPLKLMPGFPLVFGLFLGGCLFILSDMLRGRLADGAAGDDTPRRGPTAGQMILLMLAFILVYYASFIPFFVNARARHPLVPLMLLAGAYGVFRLFQAFHGKRMRAGLAGTALFAALTALAAVDWVPYRPDEARWRYDRADSWLNAGAVDKAAAEAEIMLGLDYSYYMPFRLGHAFAARKRPELAARLLMASLSPDESDQPAPYRQDVLFHAGAALAGAGKTGEAKRAFGEALRLNPRDARARNDLGVLLEKEGDTAGAKQCYQAALEANPDFILARVNLAEALAREGDTAGAVAEYGRITAAAPDSAEHHYNLARHLALAGRADEAGAAYRRALELNPKELRAWNNLGLLCAEQGKTAEAEAAYRAALAADPDYTLARANLGNLFMDTGRFAEGVAVYEEGIAPAPGNAELMNGLGWRLEQHGDAETALGWYEKAAAAAPKYLAPRLNRAGLLLKLGRAADAETALREAEALAPDHPEVRRLRGAMGEAQLAIGNGDK